MDRIAKFATLKAAWAHDATNTEICLAGAIAEHETKCGDAWPGEHNWGGLQLAKLSDYECQVLAEAECIPAAPYTEAGRDALIQARGLISRLDGALHADSSPTRGWYFVWFYAFPTAKQGAEVFVSRLLGYAGVPAALKMGDSHLVAEEMYRGRYFEGFHKPDPTPEEDFPGKWPREGWLRVGPLTAGETKNVEDYATAIAKLLPLWRDVTLKTTVPDPAPAPGRLPSQPVAFPDLRAGETIRQRVARIAVAAAPLTQAHDLKQLGYFLSARQEAVESRMAYMATSCGTFARAVLLWSGCRSELLIGSYPVGSAVTRLCQLAGLWTDRKGWVACTGPKGPQPEQGDIFRIQTPGQNDDHVGVITDVLGDWQFCTSEGGQGSSGCDVGSFVRQFAARGPAMYCGSRPLQGWIVCDRVGLPDSPEPIAEPIPAPEEAIPAVPVVPVPVPAATAQTQLPTVVGARTGLAVGGGVAAVAASQWVPWWAIVAVVAVVLVVLVLRALVASKD